MKTNSVIIACTALLAVITNPGFAQLQQVEVPEPSEPPEAPEAAALAAAYDVAASVFGSGGSTAGRTLIIPNESL